MADPWGDASERTEALVEHFRAMITAMGTAAAAGDMNTAVKHATEAGGLVGSLAMRAFAFQHALMNLALVASNPELGRKIDVLLEETKLPTETGDA